MIFSLFDGVFCLACDYSVGPTNDLRKSNVQSIRTSSTNRVGYLLRTPPIPAMVTSLGEHSDGGCRLIRLLLIH